ncbi:MAG: prepilin-type N-terminal cleavage/methylation domain-containing protein [Bacillota bacterium]
MKMNKKGFTLVELLVVAWYPWSSWPVLEFRSI